MSLLYAFLFGGFMVLGLVCGILFWRGDAGPFPRESPRLIFRLVHREDRAAYRRIMRRTMAVQFRDFGRAMNRAGRQLAMIEFKDAFSASWRARR
jgi:hypothetical protein